MRCALRTNTSATRTNYPIYYFHLPFRWFVIVMRLHWCTAYIRSVESLNGLAYFVRGWRIHRRPRHLAQSLYSLSRSLSVCLWFFCAHKRRIYAHIRRTRHTLCRVGSHCWPSAKKRVFGRVCECCAWERARSQKRDKTSEVVISYFRFTFFCLRAHFVDSQLVALNAFVCAPLVLLPVFRGTRSACALHFFFLSAFNIFSTFRFASFASFYAHFVCV